MCGIFGFLVQTGEGPDLDLAVQALRHRGPDGSGTFVDRGVRETCGLAHTRLAILDLSEGGRQPMHSADGRWVLVFNGEIYNFREIRAELAAAGARFRSHSDSEVLLEAFGRWGVDSLARLRGMFAFAVWDRRERALFIARDRLGVKPLYIARTPGALTFASEVRALLATKAASRRLSAPGLESFLAFGSVVEPHTLLDGVTTLGPGEWLSMTGGVERRGRYWELPAIVPVAAKRPDVDELRALLLESVTLRLESDAPLGVFLSGGLDSAAIAILASRALGRRLHTFTVTTDEPSFDEGDRARSLARGLGCHHHECVLETSQMAGEVADAVAALDQPSADGLNTYFVSRAARACGLVVALSGIGSDEIFAGYGAFRWFGRALFAKRALGPLRVPRWWRPELTMHARARKGLDLVDARPGAYGVYGVMRAMFPSGLRRRLFARGEDWESPRDAARVQAALDAGETDPINVFGTLELAGYVRNTLLRDTDAMSMAHSFEVREPLLDHKLIERMMAVPGPLKLSPHGNKPLLMAAVPEIPRERATTPKVGFTLPVERWMKSSLRSWMAERLLDQCPGFLDRHTVKALWRAFDEGRPVVSWARLWSLAVLADWCARHRAEL